MSSKEVPVTSKSQAKRDTKKKGDKVKGNQGTVSSGLKSQEVS